MAVKLVNDSSIHKASAVDLPIRLFGQSTSLHMLIRCHVLDYLSSDLVFGMEQLQTYNPVIDWIGTILDLCVNGVSITVVSTAAGQCTC